MEKHSRGENITASVLPDYSRFDSAEDILRDAERWGMIDELRTLLLPAGSEPSGAVAQVVRDIAYELAGSKNRALAVDVFIHAAGIAELGKTSLREYADRNRVSHEWFRQQVMETRRRLGIPPQSVLNKGDSDAS